jgi:hypothetical protein
MSRRIARPGPWYPLAVEDDPQLAAAMAELAAESNEVYEARAIPDGALSRELGSLEVERIMDLLRNPTIAQTRRSAELRVEAKARLGARTGLGPVKRAR